MQSYNTSHFGANEYGWGYASGQVGAWRQVGDTFEIQTEGSDVALLGAYRQPSPQELLGLVVALVENGMDINPWDYDAYADSVCTCYDLPDGRSHVCGNCLDASAARWENEIPF